MATQRIAALVGDFYHQAELMIDALKAATASQYLAVDVFTDPTEVPWQDLGAYRGLVLARENRIAPEESKAVWATDVHEAAIAGFTIGGGALVALHAGLASYRQDGPLFEMVRGTFLFHPPERPRFKVVSRGIDHPAIEGFTGMEIMDELYFVRVDSARTTRLLESSSPDYGTSCAAWVHEAGKGRVFCLTPGHFPEVLANPEYRRVLSKGMRWALGSG